MLETVNCENIVLLCFAGIRGVIVKYLSGNSATKIALLVFSLTQDLCSVFRCESTHNLRYLLPLKCWIYIYTAFKVSLCLFGKCSRCNLLQQNFYWALNREEKLTGYLGSAAFLVFWCVKLVNDSPGTHLPGTLTVDFNYFKNGLEFGHVHFTIVKLLLWLHLSNYCMRLF